MELIDYLQEIELPNEMIEPRGLASTLFLRNGIHTFWEAIIAVQRLPYDRTSDRGNYFQVLEQQRGSCSGKHALISALAREIEIPIKLCIGIFLLTPENNPQIASLLKKYRLEAIPEAHTFLRYNGKVLDITFPDSVSFSFDLPLEEEYEIAPQQIGEFKVHKHQEFIRRWASNIPFEIIWKAREEWIQRLRKLADK